MKMFNFKKPTRVSTYSKVVVVLSIVTTGFLIIFSALFYYNFKLEKEQFDKEVNALLDLNSESYLTLINEITYWDELVNFVEKKDIRWFDSSLAYLVDTYRVDYIDSYNMNEEFVTKVSTTKINSSNFIPKEVFTKLKKNKLIKFHIRIPEGVVQVYGATIHSSEDPFKNKTKPRGYLFMVKLLDAKFFSNLENITSSNIGYISNKSSQKANTINYLKQINDLNNKPIANLLFSRQNKVDFTQTKTLLVIMLISFLVSILIFFYFAKKWAQKPLKLIREVLENGSPKAIEALKNIRGEFKYIGKLFEEKNEQKIKLQKAKNKAEESDKLKSAFLMNLSHEIRTPMNAIMGFSELLLQPESTETEKTEYIKNVRLSGNNLIAILDDLVEMSKIDSNLVIPNYTSINLNEFVQNIFENVKISKELNEDIDFKLLNPKTLIKKNIVTDATKLNEILTNLLINAIKFTKKGFIILEYSIDEKLNWINFQVKDSGIGIPEENQKNIFTRFNKVDFIMDCENKGLGLGLAIAKSYIDMLGGTITVKSKPEIGSTFSFSIPFIFDQNETNYNDIHIENQEAVRDLGSEEIILVAEDENINFLVIEKLLKLFNFKILRAKNGTEAIEICKENKEIDMVLMDIKMPELDGHETFKKIREFNKKIPIIAQTAYSFPEEIEKIKKTGFTDFISKPIEKEKLFKLIKLHMYHVT
jgi:signal transduction histidine kinase/CheY-like chemotaxis protein